MNKWTSFGQAWRDGRSLVRQLPGVVGLYLAPDRLPAAVRERIWVELSARNDCRICLGVHRRWSERVGPPHDRELERAALAVAGAEPGDEPADLVTSRHLLGSRHVQQVEAARALINFANRFNNTWDQYLRRDGAALGSQS
jgi:AhpD family alkylhydroperoxidase